MADSIYLGGGGAVTVDAAGALDGDGSIADPLAVIVDGVTITINGSNQLTTTAGGGNVSAAGTLANNAVVIGQGTTAVATTTTGTGILTALGVNVGSAGAPVVQNGALGTPSSGTLTNATGLPVATGVGGLGTGVATALAVNVGSAGAPVVLNGALGTPSSGTLTSATGLPLTTGVTGALPIANGGTANTTATAAFDALAPTTTAGDVSYHNGTDNVRLGVGTAGQVLTVNAGATAPEWATPGAGGAGAVVNLKTFFADVATTGTSIETLATYAMPGGTLGVDGDALSLKAWFIGTQNATNTLTITFGGTTLIVATLTTGPAGFVEIVLYRLGATTQKAAAFKNTNASGYENITQTTPAETLSGSINILIRGTSATGAGAVTFKAATITKIPAQ